MAGNLEVVVEPSKYLLPLEMDSSIDKQKSLEINEMGQIFTQTWPCPTITTPQN